MLLTHLNNHQQVLGWHERFIENKQQQEIANEQLQRVADKEEKAKEQLTQLKLAEPAELLRNIYQQPVVIVH